MFTLVLVYEPRTVHTAPQVCERVAQMLLRQAWCTSYQKKREEKLLLIEHQGHCKNVTNS